MRSKAVVRMKYFNDDLYAMLHDSLFVQAGVETTTKPSTVSNKPPIAGTWSGTMFAVLELLQKEEGLVMFVGIILIFFGLMGVMVAMFNSEVRALTLERFIAGVPFLNSERP